MSLNVKLLEWVKRFYPNMCPLDSLLELCDHEGYKQSNGERQLRLLAHSGIIKAIKNDKHYITGYIHQPDTTSVKFTQKSVKFEAIQVKVDNQPPKSQNRLFQPPAIYN